MDYNEVAYKHCLLPDTRKRAKTHFRAAHLDASSITCGHAVVAEGGGSGANEESHSPVLLGLVLLIWFYSNLLSLALFGSARFANPLEFRSVLSERHCNSVYKLYTVNLDRPYSSD